MFILALTPYKMLLISLSGNKDRDISTCGVLHSIGSDLTRMKVLSDTNLNGSTRSEQTITKRKELGNTPTSRVEVSCIHEASVFECMFLN